MGEQPLTIQPIHPFTNQGGAMAMQMFLQELAGVRLHRSLMQMEGRKLLDQLGDSPLPSMQQEGELTKAQVFTQEAVVSATITPPHVMRTTLQAPLTNLDQVQDSHRESIYVQ